MYRRHHKKGITEEVHKRRARKTIKHERAIVGASLDLIKQRRTQKPEARKAQRESDLAAAKEQKKIEKAKRKAAKAKTVANQANATKVSKQGAKGAFQKVAATSR